MDIFAPFDVGGYRLYLYCEGSGSPTVVLDTGLGDASGSWNKVYPQVAGFTRVCLYDRAGLGRSDGGPQPRTSAHMVNELHSLLQKAGIPGPYVLVGHSFGGLNMRLFAHQYPNEVVGLVEVEALPDIRLADVTPLMSPPERAELQAFLHWNLEGVDIQASLDQARAITSLGALPMVVLARGRPDPGSLGVTLAHAALGEQFWRQWEQKLLHLSSQSTLVIAQNSGHYIQYDEPNLVLNTIRELVDAG